MSCQVCGVQGAEPHFGAITCGACAAFFRRYFHSKKAIISCSCLQRLRNSHPCRECRMKKCLAIGMQETKVQKQREKHPTRKPLTNLAHFIKTPIEFLIVSRNTTKISSTTSNWLKLQDQREYLYRKTIDESNYYELTFNKRADSLLLWEIATELFPEVLELERLDRDSLLRNFLPKWSVLAAAIDVEYNTQKYQKLKTHLDYQQMIANFYKSSFSSKHPLSDKEILKVFEPIVTFYGVNVILPMKERAFDKTEYMALALLILFDSAYTNISVECAETCYNIRKLIMKELKGYQIDQNREEMRFVETMDSLNIIERGERKFYEELILCDMHGVELHEDFQLMLKEHNT